MEVVPLKIRLFQCSKGLSRLLFGGISCFYQVSQNNQMNYKVMYVIQKELQLQVSI